MTEDRSVKALGSDLVKIAHVATNVATALRRRVLQAAPRHSGAATPCGAATARGAATRAHSVAVIASAEDLRKAQTLRRLPDFFELRLDCLNRALPDVDEALANLSTPIIITARHPLEGGANALSLAQRRSLLLRYLPRAALIDVELRSAAQLKTVFHAAERHDVGLIISVHELRRMPSQSRLEQLLAKAKPLQPDVFKIATRTETKPELDRLLQFFDAHQSEIPISAMGTGKLGRVSRRHLARRGSVLNYAHLGRAQTEGQLSLSELHRLPQ